MICTKCKLEKNEEDFEFRPDRQKFRTTCKECRNQRERELYPQRREQNHARQKVYREENRETINRKCRENWWKNRDTLLAAARERPGYGKYKPESIKKWQLQNKEKIRAHGKLHTAVKRGRVEKPLLCQLCGSGGKMNSHHADYSKPYNVIWVCDTCHAKIHSKFWKEK
jgi:hypothetical protein